MTCGSNYLLLRFCTLSLSTELTVHLLNVSSVVEGESATVCVQANSNGSTNATGQNFTVSLESINILSAGKKGLIKENIYNDNPSTHFSEGRGLS